MASSTLFSSIAVPKTLALCNSKTSSFSILSLLSPSLKLHTKAISTFRPFHSTTGFQNLSSSRFVRNVAVTSDFEQDEEVFGGRDEQSFSPDLKLFVGNLPFNVDSSDLATLFGQAGEVQLVEVIYDKITGRSRGFAFVTMSTVEEVEAAAQQFNGYELEGRPLRVNFGPPPPRREESFSSRGRDDSYSSRGGRGDSYSSRGGRGDSYSSRGGRGDSYSSGGREDSYSSRGPRGGSSFDSGNRVYVGNLSWGVDDAALENLFNEQGKVVEAKVVYDRESGRSRGFGFVTYNSSEEVNNAVESLNGADLDGRSIRVTVAESKPQRRQF